MTDPRNKLYFSIPLKDIPLRMGLLIPNSPFQLTQAYIFKWNFAISSSSLCRFKSRIYLICAVLNNSHVAIFYRYSILHFFSFWNTACVTVRKWERNKLISWPRKTGLECVCVSWCREFGKTGFPSHVECMLR